MKIRNTHISGGSIKLADNPYEEFEFCTINNVNFQGNARDKMIFSHCIFSGCDLPANYEKLCRNCVFITCYHGSKLIISQDQRKGKTYEAE